MSQDPNITIKIATTVDLSGVESARSALAELNSVTSRSPSLQPDVDTSSIDQAQTKVDKLAERPEVPVAIKSDADAITAAAKDVDKLAAKSPVRIDIAANTTQLEQVKSQIARINQPSSPLTSPAGAREQMDTYTQSAQEATSATDDLASSVIDIGSAAVQGAGVLNTTIASGTGFIAQQTAGLGRMLGILGRFAGAAGVFTTVYQAGKLMWQGLFDLYNRGDIIRERSLRKAQDAHAKEASLLSERNKQIYNEIETNRMDARHEAERRGVEAVNRSYKARLDIIAQLSAAKQVDIAAEQRVLAATRERELATKITETQSNPNAQYTGDDYMEFRAQGDMAKTLKKREDLEKKEAADELKKMNQITGQTRVAIAARAVHQTNMEAAQERRREAEKDLAEAEADQAKADKIAKDTGINLDGATSTERDQMVKRDLDARSASQKKYKEDYEAAVEERKSAEIAATQALHRRQAGERGRDAEEKTDAVKDKEAASTRAAELAAENLKKLAESSGKTAGQLKDIIAAWRASPKDGTAIERQRAAMVDAKGDHPVNKLVNYAELTAGRGYATPTQLAELTKMLAKAKASSTPDTVKRELEEVITPYISRMAGINKAESGYMGGAEQVKQARDRFSAQTYDMQRAPGHADNNNKAANDAIAATRRALANNKLSAPEAAGLKQQADKLARDTNNEYSRQVAVLVRDTVLSILAGQRKQAVQTAKITDNIKSPDNAAADMANNQSRLADKQAAQSEQLDKVAKAVIETRSRIEAVSDPLSMDNATRDPGETMALGDKLRGIMDDGEVSGGEVNELRSVIGEYQQMQSQSPGKQEAYADVISLLSGMVAMSRRQAAMSAAETREFKARLAQMQSQISTIQSQRAHARTY